MDTKNWTQKTVKSVYSITDSVAWAGVTLISGVVLLVFIDVCGRYFLNKPLLGSYALVEQAMGALGGITIMYTASKGGHIAVDSILNRFSKRTQRIMQSIYSFLGFGFLGMLAYQVFEKALDDMERKSFLQILPFIKTAPFMFVLAVGLFLGCLVLLVHIFYPVANETSDKT